MTVTLYSAAAGETQTVGSIEGYDQAEWQVIADKPASDNGEVWIYENGDWVEVVPPLPPISSLAFIGLFTLAEQLAAYGSDDAAVKLTIGQTQAAGVIHLDDPRVADGLDLLAAAHVIAPARIAEILAALPPA